MKCKIKRSVYRHNRKYVFEQMNHEIVCEFSFNPHKLKYTYHLLNSKSFLIVKCEGERYNPHHHPCNYNVWKGIICFKHSFFQSSLFGRYFVPCHVWFLYNEWGCINRKVYSKIRRVWHRGIKWLSECRNKIVFSLICRMLSSTCVNSKCWKRKKLSIRNIILVYPSMHINNKTFYLWLLNYKN